MPESPPSSQWRRALAAVQGRRSVSLLGVLIVGVLGLYPTYSLELRVFGSSALASVAVIALSLASALVLLVADRTVLRNRAARTVSIFTVVLVYVSAGAVRPVVSWLLALNSVSADQQLSLSRIAQAALAACIGLSVVAIALDANDRQLSVIRALRIETSRLQVARRQNTALLEDERRQLTSSVLVSADSMLGDLSDELARASRDDVTSSALRMCAAKIRAAVDEVVRPLSRSARQTPIATVDLEPMVVESRSAALRRLVRNAFLVRPYQPGIFSAALFLECVASFPSHFGVIGWAYCLVCPALVFVMMSFFERALPTSRLRAMSSGARVAAVLGVLIVTEFVAFWIPMMIWDSRNGGVRIDASYSSSGLIIYLSLWFLIAVGAAAIDRRELATVELMSVESALKFELAQQQIQLDEVARKLSNVLHGDVQSQLIAVALSLNMAADGFDRDHDAANARAALRDAQHVVDGLAFDDATFLDDTFRTATFVDAIGQVTQVWQGLIDVETVIPSQVAAVIEASPTCAAALVRLTGEAITNAAKHGAAGWVRITIDVDDGIANLTAEDDGIGPPSLVRPGAGLERATIGAAQVQLEMRPEGGARLSASFTFEISQRTDLLDSAVAATA